VVICSERGADDLHMVQLMPIICCFIKIQIGLIFVVPAYSGYPGQEAVQWMFVTHSFELIFTHCCLVETTVSTVQN